MRQVHGKKIFDQVELSMVVGLFLLQYSNKTLYNYAISQQVLVASNGKTDLIVRHHALSKSKSKSKYPEVAKTFCDLKVTNFHNTMEPVSLVKKLFCEKLDHK